MLKLAAKELSFHVGGYLMHNLFWKNMGPADKYGGEPDGLIADYIEKDFGSFDNFKKEFSQVAISTEGSGWAALFPYVETLTVYSSSRNRKT